MAKSTCSLCHLPRRRSLQSGSSCPSQAAPVLTQSASSTRAYLALAKYEAEITNGQPKTKIVFRTLVAQKIMSVSPTDVLDQRIHRSFLRRSRKTERIAGSALLNGSDHSLHGPPTPAFPDGIVANQHLRASYTLVAAGPHVVHLTAGPLYGAVTCSNYVVSV